MNTHTHDNRGTAMRMLTQLILSTMLAPSLASAVDSSPDARALGTTEALLGYCAKAAPSTAAHIRRELAQLTKGASADQLAQMRASEAYQQAKGSLEGFVAKVDPHNAARVCSETVNHGR